MKTKTNLSMVIITSVVCLLPLFYGLLIYNNLPDLVGIPFFGLNPEGDYNIYFHKAYLSFGMPFIIMVINILSKIILYKDPKWHEEAKAIQIFAEWVCPALSLIAVPLWLFRALGAKVPIEIILYIVIGIGIILTGNYIPKSRINKASMFGIKLPWALNISDENWIKGRRKVGLYWIIMGIIYITLVFSLHGKYLILYAIAFVTVFLLFTMPILYSYLVYINGKKDCKKEYFT